VTNRRGFIDEHWKKQQSKFVDDGAYADRFDASPVDTLCEKVLLIMK